MLTPFKHQPILKEAQLNYPSFRMIEVSQIDTQSVPELCPKCARIVPELWPKCARIVARWRARIRARWRARIRAQNAVPDSPQK